MVNLKWNLGVDGVWLDLRHEVVLVLFAPCSDLVVELWEDHEAHLDLTFLGAH